MATVVMVVMDGNSGGGNGSGSGSDGNSGVASVVHGCGLNLRLNLGLISDNLVLLM